MHSVIRPGAQIVLRLPSGILKPIEIQPNTTISIGKFGSFPSNLLLGRPYHVTYEVLDRANGAKQSTLRVVPPAELHDETLSEKVSTPAESSSRDERVLQEDDGTEFDIVGEDGQLIMRNNRLTVDDPSRQALSMEEIEELKKAANGSGKEIIAKIMAAHSALNEKTSFSLAKYTLRKSRKYMKRFTVLPMDVGLLSQLWLDKDVSRIMELREETLGLMMSWANVHFNDEIQTEEAVDGEKKRGNGRYLVIDDTCGLVVAAVAEKMGLLYQPEEEEEDSDEDDEEEILNGGQALDGEANQGPKNSEAMEIDTNFPAANGDSHPPSTSLPDPKPSSSIANASSGPKPGPSKRRHAKPTGPQPSSATSNTITVIHANTQPNLSHLKYFNFVVEEPSPSHPLYTHLKTLTWLQLLDPASDSLYQEPEFLNPQQLSALKSGKRGAYFRKRRRWEKTKDVVDEAREGGFDALVVASNMDPKGVMKHLVPLVRGGGQIVVYSPSPEPLTILMDLYSRDRKGAYVRLFQQAAAGDKAAEKALADEEDFPLNPTLLLNPMLQTARAREWQVLPQRTHPMMTSRGGSEGYLFTATRVLPAEGVKVEARGKFGKKRRAELKAGLVTEGENKAEAEKGDEEAEESSAKKVKVTEGGEEREKESVAENGENVDDVEGSVRM